MEAENSVRLTSFSTESSKSVGLPPFSHGDGTAQRRQPPNPPNRNARTEIAEGSFTAAPRYDGWRLMARYESCVVSDSKSPSLNPITTVHNAPFVYFVILSHFVMRAASSSASEQDTGQHLSLAEPKNNKLILLGVCADDCRVNKDVGTYAAYASNAIIVRFEIAFALVPRTVLFLWSRVHLLRSHID